jgi:hypothetical protein
LHVRQDHRGISADFGNEEFCGVWAGIEFGGVAPFK